MRERNGSSYVTAVLVSLLALLVLSGSAFAASNDSASREGGEAQAAGSDEAGVEAQGTDTEGLSEEGSEGVGAAGSEGNGSGETDSGDRDCQDFGSQAEAQDAFEEAGGTDGDDPERLDADGDGEACEDSFGDEGFPEGGVETGLGGAIAGPSGGSRVNLPLAAGGTALALLSFGLAAIALRRRA